MKVGLEVLLAENHWLRRAPRYTEIRDVALRAEAMGFDSLWLYDHLLYRDAEGRPHGIWECWTMLSALAEATEHAEIGSLVACTAFRNPALLAKMAATLDEISGGRFTLGLGAGWNAAEFVAFGLPFDHRVTRFQEALQIITALAREGRVAFQGTYHSTPGCEILPRGPRPGGPPIMIGWLPDTRTAGMAATSPPPMTSTSCAPRWPTPAPRSGATRRPWPSPPN
jgi:alkanesulfonate monooxygenase SsuD/methylene tetrahydromethanopterin reductase-like flavin-dependent oxidoreductase (luciferase family)